MSFTRELESRIAHAKAETRDAREAERRAVDEAMLAAFEAKERILLQAEERAWEIEEEARKRAAALADGCRLGVDYEGGVLDLPSRTAIHMAHRIWALAVVGVLGVLALGLLRQRETRPGGALLGGVLLAQVTLGILNVWLFLPLPNAVAHNATGALLLATTVWLLYRARDPNERS